MASASTPITDEERRWVVTGVCLTKVVIPALRNVVATEIPKWYQVLCQPPIEIDKQVFGSHQTQLPPSTLNLNYKNINNNHVHRSPAFDYTVKDPLSLAKLFVLPFMCTFTGFDQTMDMSAVLLISEVAPFSGAAAHAREVRYVRNKWAQSCLGDWTEETFIASFQSMETLLRSLNLSSEEEQKLCNELNSWKDKGMHFRRKVDELWEAVEKQAVLEIDIRNFDDSTSGSEETEPAAKFMQVSKPYESPELWKWEETSIIHRNKFVKLHEYGRDHPQEIKEVNDVRVCFSKEFVVGKGSDATKVYAGLGKDGYERAVKRLSKDDCTDLAKHEQEALNELNSTESNHVVNYRFLDDKSDKDWLFLIMDLCEETLKKFVERSSLDGWSTIARDIIQQILQGLADLHRDPKPILHRDLKPNNILRNVHDKWLLADFGISRILTEDATLRSMERGTKDWKAVESCSLNGMSDDGKVRYKKESDIQVAGMVAFYTLTKGEHPFGEEPDRHRNLLDGNPVYMVKLRDPAAEDLISWMLSHDPKDRPSAKQALKHPYLKSEKKQFEMLCKVGNEIEIKRRYDNSDVVQELNKDPRYWKFLVEPDILKYFSINCLTGKRVKYSSSWADCLRFIRNVKEHWQDQPRPRSKEFYLMGDPQEYFLNIFPNLPVAVHRIGRLFNWSADDERPDLKEYFI